MRTIKFCSVVFGVTSSLPVINKIYWRVARRRLLIAEDGRRIRAITCTTPSKCWQHATVQQWSMATWDIGRKSRFLPQLGRPRQNMAIMFDMQKPEWCGYQAGKKSIRLLVSTNYTNVTDRRWRDRQTDTARRHRPRLCIASRGKNRTFLLCHRNLCCNRSIYVLPCPSRFPSRILSVLCQTYFFRFARKNTERLNSREIITAMSRLNNFVLGEIGTGTM